MRCDRCSREGILFQRYSGLRLCGDHAAASLEARAKRMIRAGGWVRPGDRIAIGLSGGLCSSSLLRFLSVNFGMRRDLTLVAITVDDGHGAGPGRDMARIRRMAEGMEAEWAGGAIPDVGRELHRELQKPGTRENSFSLQPGLREYALVSLASRMGATKLALGTSLDDVAGALFLRVIRGEAARLPVSPSGARGEMPCIRPFFRVPEEELLLYARLKGIDYLPGDGPGHSGSLEGEAGRMLLEYTRRHPSALFSLARMAEALSGQGLSGRGGPLPHGGRNRDGTQVTRHV